MGNSDSNFTCEGAELQSTNTWWGRGQRTSGRSYRKPNQPIRSQSRATKHQNVELNMDFGPFLSHSVFEKAWPDPQDDPGQNDPGQNNPGQNCPFLRVKDGSLSSEENLDKCDINLSNSSCPDSGFGESFPVPSPVSSRSPGWSPDLVLAPDLKDLMRTGAETGMKDVFRSRIRKWSDWTGSLRIKKRRVQDPDRNSIWSFNPLQNPDLPQIQVQEPNQTKTLEDQRLSIYQNFRQDLESKSTLGSTKTSSDSADPGDQHGLRSRPGLNQDPGLDRGVVRRAGWIWIKPLIKLNKDQLELVQRRKWKKYWVKLRGCWLQFFKSPGLDQDPDQDLEQDLGPVMELHEEALGPVMELRVWDSLVQPVPEHPTKEHVFCLSNAVGQVYLLQACSQSDLEAWITSIHSVAAATASRRSGHHGDTLDFLREHVHFLSLKMEAEQRVKKTATLQLSLITETDKRRSIQAQIGQWEQSVESLSLDVFRFRSYLTSVQGLELPNPKSPLCAASRASKCMLGKLGLFNVSTLHALVCSRDQAALRRHGRALIGQTRERRAPIGRSVRRRRSFRAAAKNAERQNEEEPMVKTRQVQQEKHEALTLLLSRSSAHLDYGFAVIGQVDAEGRSHIYISQVDPNGLSANQGLCVGDQVVSVNGTCVSRLDLDLIPSVFSHRTLLLSLWRRHASPDLSAANQEWASMSHDLRDADFWTPQSDDPLTTTSSEQSSDRINSLHQIFPECRAAEPDAPKNPYAERGEAEFHAPSPYSSSLSSGSPSHLSACQRIRKVVEELLETEKSYVKDLSLLFDLYLTPLQHQTFLSKHEMEALFGSLPAMLDFQRVFLQTLEEKIDLSPELSRPETPEESKKLLFSLGGSFLYYADHFKLYSGFCSNHLKVQKVLHRAKTDTAFKHFLDTRNPTNQHSASLESFLIKPVQRVLKYPLLLRELVSLTDERTPERLHLSEALKSMEKVASHINEMQKIYEEFGPVFERLTAENGAPYAQVRGVAAHASL
ncbi:rho guanine nucleotide exchange factor TIAM2-like [Eucyclogobius newberryi]|uniref:rho guanine nucleotide exchange factor TIAM2-like n=1 Tax=Eucyclogobius newberryi TaxID=166745 RepID=UPI003B5C5337